jgi:hypothetical protein
LERAENLQLSCAKRITRERRAERLELSAGAIELVVGGPRRLRRQSYDAARHHGRIVTDAEDALGNGWPRDNRTERKRYAHQDPAMSGA